MILTIRMKETEKSVGKWPHRICWLHNLPAPSAPAPPPPASPPPPPAPPAAPLKMSWAMLRQIWCGGGEPSVLFHPKVVFKVPLFDFYLTRKSTALGRVFSSAPKRSFSHL